MTDRNSFRFKMGGQQADESPQPLPGNDVPDDRKERLVAPVKTVPGTGRIVGAFVAVTILFAAALAWVTFDTNRRLARFETAGASEYQNLSQQLQSRFANLAIRQAELEARQAQLADRFKTNLPALEKNLGRSADRLGKAEKRVDTVSKAQKKLTGTLSAQGKSIQAIQKELTAAGQQSEAAAEALAKLTAESDRRWASLDERLTALADIDKRIQALEASQIGKRDLDLILLNAKVAYQEELRNIRGEIDAAIEDLDRRLKQALTREKPARNTPTDPPAPAANPSGGGIVEQEIKN
jgi:chromosome segregation ATPase